MNKCNVSRIRRRLSCRSIDKLILGFFEVRLSAKNSGKLSKRRGKVSLVSRGWSINYRSPITLARLSTPPFPSTYPAISVPARGAARRESIFIKLLEQNRFISQGFSCDHRSLPGPRGGCTRSLEGQQVEFISTKPGETAQCQSRITSNNRNCNRRARLNRAISRNGDRYSRGGERALSHSV